MSDFEQGFRNAVGRMLMKHGSAFDRNANSWGDSRGVHLHKDEQHVRTCSFDFASNFNDKSVWSISDSFNSEDHTGVQADITCVCGDVTDVTFIFECDGLGEVLGLILMESD